MKKTTIRVSHTVDYTHMVLTTSAAFGNVNRGFDRDAARALIADQLAVFLFLWPDAPAPQAEHSALVPYLMGKKP